MISSGADIGRSQTLNIDFFLIKKTNFGGLWGVSCTNFGENVQFPSYLMISFWFGMKKFGNSENSETPRIKEI